MSYERLGSSVSRKELWLLATSSLQSADYTAFWSATRSYMEQRHPFLCMLQALYAHVPLVAPMRSLVTPQPWREQKHALLHVMPRRCEGDAPVHRRGVPHKALHRRWQNRKAGSRILRPWAVDVELTTAELHTCIRASLIATTGAWTLELVKPDTAADQACALRSRKFRA